MAIVKFKDLTKSFGQEIPAVDNINLEIIDKEFLVLVGPSGCGKTTTLRMLAGLEIPTSGKIFIDDKDVTKVAPKDRNIAMVFQSYALYPHMSVRDNLAFGIKNRELKSSDKYLNRLVLILTYLSIIFTFWIVSYLMDFVFKGNGSNIFAATLISFLIGLIVYPESRKVIHGISMRIGTSIFPSQRAFAAKLKEINGRIVETAKILEIEELLKRKPKQLSGGQRQRVAVGRAIIREPSVFLMDEPLSNLDAKLRNSTRAELADLQQRLGITTVYVTHDQVEAMTLGHRIAIMNNGIIEQLGTPSDVYGHPNTAFVAGFIGSPSMNLLAGRLIFQNDNYILESLKGNKLLIPKGFKQEKYADSFIEKNVILGFRPEHTKIIDSSINTMVGKMKFSEAIGSITSIFLDMGQETINIVIQGYKHYDLGAEIYFELDPEHLHLFDVETNLRIELVNREETK
jgi:multiple sugar transport system ATP-binding protein